jgi:hypothetical protein
LFGLDVEAIRPATIMGRAGAKMLVTSEPLVTIPRQDAPLPDAQWIARDADLTLQGDLGTRSQDLTPHEVGSYHKILRSGRLYGTPGLVDLYTSQIISKQLYAVDWAVLCPGGVEPSGLSINARTQRFQFGGAPALAQPTLSDYVAMSGLLDGSAAPEDNLGWLMNSLLRSMAQASHKLSASTDSVTIRNEGDQTLLNHPMTTGQQIPPGHVWFLDAGQSAFAGLPREPRRSRSYRTPTLTASSPAAPSYCGRSMTSMSSPSIPTAPCGPRTPSRLAPRAYLFRSRPDPARPRLWRSRL